MVLILIFSVSNDLRQRLNYFLFKKLIELNSKFFGSWDPTHRFPIHGYAYDCSTILFCIKPIVKKNESKEFWIDRVFKLNVFLC